MKTACGTFLLHPVCICWNLRFFFFFLIFQNQSVVGDVIQLNKKKKSLSGEKRQIWPFGAQVDSLKDKNSINWRIELWYVQLALHKCLKAEIGRKLR